MYSELTLKCDNECPLTSLYLVYTFLRCFITNPLTYKRYVQVIKYITFFSETIYTTRMKLISLASIIFPKMYTVFTTSPPSCWEDLFGVYFTHCKIVVEWKRLSLKHTSRNVHFSNLWHNHHNLWHNRRQISIDFASGKWIKCYSSSKHKWMLVCVFRSDKKLGNLRIWTHFTIILICLTGLKRGIAFY